MVTTRPHRSLRILAVSALATLAVTATNAAAETESTHRELTRLTAPGAREGIELGLGLAVGHNLIAVGSQGNNTTRGTINLYRRPAKGWSQVTRPYAVLRSHRYALIGRGLVMSGNTIAVLAAGPIKSPNPREVVAVFQKAKGGWSHTREPKAILADPPADKDSFGVAVAMGHNVIAVGANGDSSGQGRLNGQVAVFVKPRSGWHSTSKPTATLRSTDARHSDDFGSSIAIAGRTMVVGAPEHSIGRTQYVGEAYVFTRPPRGWQHAKHEQARLRASNGEQEEEFGYAVAVAGSHVVVGGPYRDGKGTIYANQGAAYIFTRPSHGWAGIDHTSASLAKTPNHHSGTFFGWALAIRGRTVAVGAPATPHGSKGYAGAVAIYHLPSSRPAGSLRPVQIDRARKGGFEDAMGSTVALTSRTVVAGAPHDVSTGPDLRPWSAAYVFSL